MNAYHHCCPELKNAVEDEDIAISYAKKFREYGIRILDGGSSRLRINFCPWCGQRLPNSLRDAWFDELELRGIDPDADIVPDEFSDDRWYRDLNL
jgi:hypothetical protein